MDRLADWFIAGQINVLSVVISMFFCAIFAMMWSNRKTLNCIDLITSKDSKLSRIAIGECLMILVCVFLPIYQTVHGKVEADIFAICMACLGGSAGFGKWLRARSDRGQKE